MKGFHLIELLITLAIIGILTSVGFPLYTQHITHARRLEAAGALSKLAIAMERFHIEQNTYEGATLAALHFSGLIAKDNYQLIIASASQEDYLLKAIPLGKQAEKDWRCGSLMLDAAGKKEVTGMGGIEDCW